MDTPNNVFYGPHPIQKSGTVTIPAALLKHLGLEAGDEIHWVMNPDIEGTLVLVSGAKVATTTSVTLDALRAVMG